MNSWQQQQPLPYDCYSAYHGYSVHDGQNDDDNHRLQLYTTSISSSGHCNPDSPMHLNQSVLLNNQICLFGCLPGTCYARHKCHAWWLLVSCLSHDVPAERLVRHSGWERNPNMMLNDRRVVGFIHTQDYGTSQSNDDSYGPDTTSPQRPAC